MKALIGAVTRMYTTTTFYTKSLQVLLLCGSLWGLAISRDWGPVYNNICKSCQMIQSGTMTHIYMWSSKWARPFSINMDQKETSFPCWIPWVLQNFSLNTELSSWKGWRLPKVDLFHEKKKNYPACKTNLCIKQMKFEKGHNRSVIVYCHFISSSFSKSHLFILYFIFEWFD